MHELSVAMEICRMTEALVGSESASRVRVVAVEVGDDSGLEPESLEFCLEALLQDPPFEGAVPRIVRTTGETLRVDYLEVDDGRPDDRGP